LIRHLNPAPESADRHEKALVRHTAELSRTLGRPADFRLGPLDPFAAGHLKIRHPKAVEIRLFQRRTI